MNFITTNDIPKEYLSLSSEEIKTRTRNAKKKLKDGVLILAHNYQVDDIVEFADFSGDSLELAKKSVNTPHDIIVFCGVHFMAESTDILNNGKKIVTLPNLEAGCALADMATMNALEIAWKAITEMNEEVIPLTYVNSSAEVKAFCGEHGGYTCTSGNAQKMLKYLFKQGKTVLFLPDENLGTNSAKMLGLSDEEIASWNWKTRKLSGSPHSPIIIWQGYCPVHTPFSVADIERLREEDPDINILVHPECTPEVAEIADFIGSTSKIISIINDANAGSKWAIGTEINLVNRLRDANPDKEIQCLKSYSCACSYMARIKPEYLLWNLESIIEGNIINRISVPEEISAFAKVALDRMIAF